jgi:hypothetical protein
MTSLKMTQRVRYVLGVANSVHHLPIHIQLALTVTTTPDMLIVTTRSQNGNIFQYVIDVVKH